MLFYFFKKSKVNMVMLIFLGSGQWVLILYFSRVQASNNHIVILCFHGFEFSIQVEMALEFSQVWYIFSANLGSKLSWPDEGLTNWLSNKNLVICYVCSPSSPQHLRFIFLVTCCFPCSRCDRWMASIKTCFLIDCWRQNFMTSILLFLAE